MSTETNGLNPGEAMKTIQVYPPARSLVRKLAEIMGEVERVEKNGQNHSQGYAYATEADIAAAVRKAMSKRLVMLIPSVLETTWETIQTKSGGGLKLCTLKVRFTLEDGESGETREYVVMGQGTDNGDKATYKAMTGAEKYALLKLFLIPTGDDPEKDEPRQEARQQQAPRQQAAQAPQAKPAAQTKPVDPAEQALRARRIKLWNKAKAGGATQESFLGWASQVLGRAVKNSTELAAADVDTLEVTQAEAAKAEQVLGGAA